MTHDDVTTLRLSAALVGLALAAPACTSGSSPNGEGDGVSSDSALVAQPLGPGAPAGRTFSGPAVPIGNGMGQAWASFDQTGDPSAVGLTLSEQALTGLPSEPAEYVLLFHPRFHAEPFTHLFVGYNPHGHEPPGIYDIEHFDVHFYLQSVADREAIGPNDLAEFAKAPEPQYIPPLYLQIPGGVPQMGAHWVDLLAPELNGGTFTRTLLWGSYDGEVTFLEPMLTKAYLAGKADESVAMRQPEAFQKDGFYPTSYRVTFDERGRRYRISLEGLTYHEAQ
jgi:hypothetical protein